MCFVSLVALSTIHVRAAEDPLTSDTAARCEQILIESSKASGEWTSVHAAEYLIRLGMAEKTLDTFRAQADNASPPFRIGVWRVLAQAETPAEQREKYIERIRDVLLDEQAIDRLHALESLAKLEAPIESRSELAIVQEMSNPKDAGCSFALWRLHQQRPSVQQLDGLVKQLSSEDSIARLRAGFVLSQLDNVPDKVQTIVQTAMTDEPVDSVAYPYVASAGGSTSLHKLLKSKNPSDQTLAIRELTLRSEAFDFPLGDVLGETHPLSLRQAAAFALLKRSQ